MAPDGHPTRTPAWTSGATPTSAVTMPASRRGADAGGVGADADAGADADVGRDMTNTDPH
ncbi:hypothetical protein BL254_06155 [Protofrankia sp. BMG5.30]|uniref:Uncharacterized protein n=1 Tax=Protofrankia coriariae TaxID=1562887 RepID=A0ABR5F5D0_9ACTN|nr:hypothetical protein FrCorBMG51_07865 [Protofrankia coriariae]ONH36810.1 hypothetical protein BL254_06155 [Protofrankia sp. BMG5.30]